MALYLRSAIWDDVAKSLGGDCPRRTTHTHTTDAQVDAPFQQFHILKEFVIFRQTARTDAFDAIYFIENRLTR
jgi:hypothetical protein